MTILSAAHHIYNVLSPEPSTWIKSSHLILTITLPGGYYYSYFINEKTEAQRSEQQLPLLGGFELRQFDSNAHSMQDSENTDFLRIIRKLVPGPPVH